MTTRSRITVVWSTRATKALSRIVGLALLTGSLGCSAGSQPSRAGDEALAGARGGAGFQGGSTASTAIAGASSTAARRRGRTPLGDPELAPIEPSIEPMNGGRSVLFVAQSAGNPVTWARRFSGATGRMGPLLRLTGEYVLSAFEREGERMTLVSSDGERLCIATYAPESATPEGRGCAAIDPFAVAPLGEKLALIELQIERPPEPPAAKKAAGAGPSAGSKAKPKAGSSAKPKGKATPKKTVKRKATPKKKKQPEKSASASAARKPSKSTKKPAARRTETAARPPRKDWANVRLRWVTSAGEFDAESALTGLRFERPLEGMGLVDVRGRPGALDLLWFEASPKRRTVAPMGSARLAAGSIRADGMFDPGSLVPVLEGDLEYGAITGHHGARLVATDAGSAFVGLTGRPGGCEAVRVTPQLAPLRPAGAVCSVAPHLLASPQGGAAGDDLAALEKILAAEPRRAFGQPRHDPGLAAWAGDRAFFLSEGKLRWASRADGEAGDAEPPFPARRSRIAWSAFAPDGEGLAFGAGGVHRVDAEGRLEKVGGAASAGGASRGESALRAAEVPGVERRRAARIGSSWWVARGDVTRVLPGPAVESAALRGRAPADATALVGGRERGFFLALAGGRLDCWAIDAEGNVRALGGGKDADGSGGGSGSGSGSGSGARHAIASPVRAGFDASERAAGGAIVAGVSASDPRKVVAFILDPDGRMSGVRETSLTVKEGEIPVRLTALPGGGAVLSDLARRRAVWLDDDAREIGAAPWPAEDSGALCVDGIPGRAQIPSPEPGKFVPAPDLGAPGSCIVGDFAWAKDGSLRWFGSFVEGLDALAEVAVIPAAAPTPAAAKTTSATDTPDARQALARAANEPPCPPEMVSIAGRFCVDRFESMLMDAATGEPLSPDYPATPNLLELTLTEWTTGRSRIGSAQARAFPMPFLPRWQRGAKTQPMAVARMGVRPNGYVTGLVAESACAAAGKRLCGLDEFIMACRGEDDTLFPYGDTYEDGVCNVFRDEHPAAMLHGNASVGHLDPRLNRVQAKGRPLLRTTGGTPQCRSRWGSDAVYDMVGNLDEWVDEEGGAFAGGFYSRSTRSGCEALVTAHPKPYLDYSTGIRCCRDAAGAGKDP